MNDAERNRVIDDLLISNRAVCQALDAVVFAPAEAPGMNGLPANGTRRTGH